MELEKKKVSVKGSFRKKYLAPLMLSTIMVTTCSCSIIKEEINVEKQKYKVVSTSTGKTDNKLSEEKKLSDEEEYIFYGLLFLSLVGVAYGSLKAMEDE